MDTRLGRRFGTTAAAWLLAILPAVPAVHAQIPCSYEVSAVIQGPLCPIFGFPPTYGRGITENGEVVGSYNSCVIGPSEGFYWSESTGFVTLDRPPGYVSAGASDIDSATGWIVGSMEPQGTNLSTAALWVDGGAIDLGTLPGGNFSQARATNGVQIIGKWGNTVAGPIHGFIWEDGVMTDVGPILDANSSRAEDVSASGGIVGWRRENPGDERIAYLLNDNVVRILGPIPGGYTSEGWGISDDGSTVVGVGRIIDDNTGDDFSRAFVWHDGKMVNLGTLPGFNHAGAFAVNDDLIVVGGASQPGGSAFIWSERDRRIIELNDLIPPETGVDISLAYAIDNLGKITGVGHNAAGDVVALLLTPMEARLGDLDGDCHVGVFDLLLLLYDWDETDSSADLDNDGIVGILDLLILLTNWG